MSALPILVWVLMFGPVPAYPAPHLLPPPHRVPGLELDVSVEKPRRPLIVGEPVVVGVRLTNNNLRTVELVARDGSENHWVTFEVTDQARRRVERIVPEAKMRVTYEEIRILSGYFWGRTYDLSKNFKFQNAGRYTVVAFYTPSSSPNASAIATAPVEIEIVEKR